MDWRKEKFSWQVEMGVDRVSSEQSSDVGLGLQLSQGQLQRVFGDQRQRRGGGPQDMGGCKLPGQESLRL